MYMRKKVLVFLFDGFSDWEIAYLAPEINKSDLFDLCYFSIDGNPVYSMGGMQVVPNASLTEVLSGDASALILPGGLAWQNGEESEINGLVRTFFEEGKVVAAICAATTLLGRLGILDNVKHTSNDLGYLKAFAPQYKGDASYVNAPAVADKNVITANGISTIEFAKEIFERIELLDMAAINKWYRLFKFGEWCE